MIKRWFFLVLLLSLAVLIGLRECSRTRQTRAETVSKAQTARAVTRTTPDVEKQMRPIRRKGAILPTITSAAEQDQNTRTIAESSSVNTEIFARQDILKHFADGIRLGMTTQEVIRAIGAPNSIYRVVTNGCEFGRQTISFEQQVIAQCETWWLYSPNFDDSYLWDGTTYEELTVEFDDALRVKMFYWSSPVITPHMRLRRSLY